MEKIKFESEFLTEHFNKVLDRLKTLEDKIEFIMNHIKPEYINSMVSPTLQDLWDEHLSDKINDGLEKMYPSVTQDKIEEIMKEFKKFGRKTDWDWTGDYEKLESWLRNKLKRL